MTTRVTMPGAFLTSGLFLLCGCLGFAFNRRGGGQRSKWPETKEERIFNPAWGIEKRDRRENSAHRGNFVPPANTAFYVSLGTGEPTRQRSFRYR
jgi:hypothetical protein